MSNKFYHTYQNLEENTKKKFKKWLTKNYSNTPLVTYFEIIIGGCTDKKQKFYKLYPDKVYDDKQLRYLSSGLYKSLMQFIAIINMDKYKPLILCDATLYSDSNLFEEAIIEATTYATNLPYSPEKYCLQAMTKTLEHKHTILKGERNDGIFSIQLLQHLESYYLAEKLRLTCVIINNEQVFKYEQQVVPITEALVSAALQHNEITRFYAMLYLFIIGDSSNTFDELFQNLNKISPLLDVWMAKEIFVILQNSCIKRLKIGDEGAEKSLLQIYKLQIDRNILLTNNILSPWTFKNIVTIAFRLKEDEWAFQFMNDFKNFLPAHEKENVYTYNLANYYFRKKSYDRSLSLLQDVQFTDTFYKLGAKWMITKIFFEKKEWLSLEYVLQSFKQLLKREKSLNEEQKMAYYNQIKQTTVLSKAYQEYVPLKKVISTLDETQPLAEKTWITAQKEVFLQQKKYYYKMLKEDTTS